MTLATLSWFVCAAGVLLLLRRPLVVLLCHLSKSQIEVAIPFTGMKVSIPIPIPFGSSLPKWNSGKASLYRLADGVLNVAGAGLLTLGTWLLATPIDHPPLPPKYRLDGLLATFTGGPPCPARTVDGVHFSLLSDSVWNLGSKIWYRREQTPGCPGEGFLRLSYQLISPNEQEPYVGLFADFTLPPPRPRDLSGFDRLTFKVRLGQRLSESPMEVAVSLVSMAQDDANYASPTYYVPSGILSTDWQRVSVRFADFGTPRFVPYEVRLDRSSVYRIVIVIIGRPGRTVHGYVDFDDFRFER